MHTDNDILRRGKETTEKPCHIQPCLALVRGGSHCMTMSLRCFLTTLLQLSWTESCVRTLAGPPSNHAHLVCNGCQTLLMYPGGAASVRCQRCGTISGAPPVVPDASQIVCNGCRVLLSYPRGAESVQCSVCHTVTQVGRRAAWRPTLSA